MFVLRVLLSVLVLVLRIIGIAIIAALFAIGMLLLFVLRKII